MFEGFFDGSEGQVFYRRWEPDAPPAPIVQIVHGCAKHGGRYAHVAAVLTRRGSAVYADDHMGHGHSAGERALITDFEHVVDDLHTLAGRARDEQPELPYIPYDPEALSRDAQAGSSYAADPLVYHGHYKRGLLQAEVVALDCFGQDIDRLTMPVAYLHGTDDPFVPYERSLQAVRDMPTEDLAGHVYEGARHEVLNESNRDEVIGDLADWVDRIAPA